MSNKKQIIIQIIMDLIIFAVLFVFSLFKYLEWRNAHTRIDNIVCAVSFGVLLVLLNYKAIYYIKHKSAILPILYIFSAVLVVIGIIVIASQYTNSVYSSPKRAIIISNIVNISTIVGTILIELLLTFIKNFRVNKSKQE